MCHATSTFIAHLVNQAVAHEIVALQMLVLLLEKPTDDSVEIAVGFMREVGAFLAENSPKANNGVFERFRAVLHEGAIDKRTQYMIEVLFQVRRDKFKDNPAIPDGLDLVEEEEQITHRIALDDELQVQEGLSKWTSVNTLSLQALIRCHFTDLFKVDPKYEENERKYAEIKAEILGDDSDEESGSEEGSDEDEDEEQQGAFYIRSPPITFRLIMIFRIFSCSRERRNSRYDRNRLDKYAPNNLFDHHELAQFRGSCTQVAERSNPCRQ